MPANAPIGVFDSGIGGLSILRALRAELPGEDFVYLADSGHAPYGERGDAYVTARSRAIVDALRARHGIKALVVACNTATAAAIHLLRPAHPDLPIVGVEPAVKPAVAATRSGHVGVIATRGTAGSAKFQALLAGLRGGVRVTVQPCDGLAYAIERSVLQPAADPGGEVAALCRRYLGALDAPFGNGPGAIDTLVLGCTHYIFAEPVLRAVAGAEVRMIETGAPVARQVRRLLSPGGLQPRADGGRTTLLTTDDPALLGAAAAGWLGLPAGSARAALF
ncbi:MAG: Glutamate racemase [Xylophilus sp.]|nr:MAG: Glutamate racemase [Xylophilus sp.]